jgi:16S rRNA G966 N2-methylase RsmD
MAKLKINYRSIDDLNPRSNNPRIHTSEQIDEIAASIRHFGFTNPVLVDPGNGIVAGHGRVIAARQLGLFEVPTVSLSDMSEADIRAYVIADNRLAEKAGWNSELLGLELQYLSDLEIDFDVSLTGFSLPEVDLFIEGLQVQTEEPDQGDPAESIPAVSDAPPVTRLGDIWQIGRHRLICGDALYQRVYGALLGANRAQMMFTDPPYNVPVQGHVCGLGKTKHREFAMASGEMTAEAFTDFLSSAFFNLAAHTADGAIHFLCIDWRHAEQMLKAGNKVYSELKNICVWTKSNGGMGSLYRSQHEFVLVFKSGQAPHINNVELGKHGRNRTNVWSYPGVNTFGTERENLELHPTVKPLALVKDAILDCSHRNSIILDAFAGSGTTLLAAEKTGRIGYGIEVDPVYCDVIIHRLMRSCGLDATLTATGQTFDEVLSQRKSVPPCNAEMMQEEAVV